MQEKLIVHAKHGSCKTRFSEHLGRVTQQCQLNTQQPVGVHFNVAGHSNRDMAFLRIERVHSRNNLLVAFL